MSKWATWRREKKDKAMFYNHFDCSDFVISGMGTHDLDGKQHFLVDSDMFGEPIK